MKMFKSNAYLGDVATDTSKFIPSIVTYAKKNGLILLIFLITFIACSIVLFFDCATTGSVSSFSIEDYEVGQISDRTVIAAKSLPPTADNPVAITKGERIVKKGFPISAEALEKLAKMAASPEYIDFRTFANKMLYLLLVFALWYFLCSATVRQKIPKRRELITLCSFFFLVYIAATFGSKVTAFSSPFMLPVILPVVFVVVLTTVLFELIPAVYFSVILSLGVFCASNFEGVPFLFTLASAMTTARIIYKIERRGDMVVASLLLSLFNAVYIFALMIIFNHNFSDLIPIVLLTAISGFVSGILALGFLTPLELLLNTASVFRLIDLSDLNNPVMRRMLVAARGTYNHSLMVATLAETACGEIGANPLLARVGAYYHDLGKVEQSEYFVENQQGSNKHDDINPRLSASVIRSHVKKGVEKAHQMHLPQEVIDIISEHHGNSLIAYFYNEAKKLDDTVSTEEFSYAGTPPSSKESAVVMLADTVEAACRTLEKPSVSRLEKFIHQLVQSKIEHHQLDNAGLTFKDISVIESAFVNILAGYYHSRIEYPNQKDPEESKKKSEETVPNQQSQKRVEPEQNNTSGKESAEEKAKEINAESTEKHEEEKEK